MKTIIMLKLLFYHEKCPAGMLITWQAISSQPVDLLPSLMQAVDDMLNHKDYTIRLSTSCHWVPTGSKVNRHARSTLSYNSNYCSSGKGIPVWCKSSRDDHSTFLWLVISLIPSHPCCASTFFRCINCIMYPSICCAKGVPIVSCICAPSICLA